MMAERGVEVDASCIWRWVQVYSPELNKRWRPHLKPVNKSYRIDETYIKVKGSDKYLYRAVDSTGQTIDFLLTAKRDAVAAKRFLRKAIEASGNAMPRVMNVDKNPTYPAAVEELKADGTPPSDKETSVAGQGLRFFSERMANTSGNQNDAHDTEGAREMTGKRKYGRPSSLHRGAIRSHRLTRIHYQRQLALV
jgi:transposase-like protein